MYTKAAHVGFRGSRESYSSNIGVSLTVFQAIFYIYFKLDSFAEYIYRVCYRFVGLSTVP